MKKLLIIPSIVTFLLCSCHPSDQLFLPAKQQDRTKKEAIKQRSISPVTFSEYQMAYTDIEGYSFKVTCRVSPWLLQSKKDLVSATWDSISKGKELPNIDDWGFQKYGEYYTLSDDVGFSFESKIDDMYYAMGTIEIENTTSGFHFTSDRTGHPKVQIIKEGLFNYEGKFISRVFLGNEDKTDTRGVVVNAKMTSDKWGPVPFVIAYAEHFTPNSPKGESREKLDTLPLYLFHADSMNRDLVKLNVISYE